MKILQLIGKENLYCKIILQLALKNLQILQKIVSSKISSSKVSIHSHIENEDVLVSILCMFLVLLLHKMIPCEQIICKFLIYIMWEFNLICPIKSPWCKNCFGWFQLFRPNVVCFGFRSFFCLHDLFVHVIKNLR